MPIAEHPLHRSGRAALPHPAPTLGGKRQALVGTRITDVRDREPAPGQAGHACPRHERGMAAAHERPPPEARERDAEGLQTRAIERHAVVAGVPSKTARRYRPWSGIGSCTRRHSSVLTSCGFACHLLRIVWHSTVNRPFRVFPQLCVKPRKLKVSGFPSPRQPCRRDMESPFSGHPLAPRGAARGDAELLMGVRLEPTLGGQRVFAISGPRPTTHQRLAALGVLVIDSGSQLVLAVLAYPHPLLSGIVGGRQHAARDRS